ncbi:hypothetical protein DFA_12021 [Cavenderia fasciculata]|uniref:Peptidase A1 domain-containing protein n=1 Tax=Cavenderia fasciculata TaxID=261658 RepID=F4QFF0_CACFS|nr:uncharacterized protein DFA_12021 [Cavenderia fasciculata]EGG14251.1 hypothetical protein DFA_12021 [Cavenderia fasciculata]|eukprot:XP_004350960.1 hypothetical protein DFA_12021 [Cavenderia fasciculata]
MLYTLYSSIERVESRNVVTVPMYKRDNQVVLKQRSTIKHYHSQDDDCVLLDTSKLENTIYDDSTIPLGDIDIDIDIDGNSTTTTTTHTLHKINLRGGTSKSFEYFIPVWIGDNSLKEQQMFMVQVDTGSTALAIPGDNCYFYNQRKTKCKCDQGALDDLYQQGSSAETLSCRSSQCKRGCSFITPYASHPSTCGFKISYQDGSFIGGDLVTDYVTVAGLTVKAIFGNMQAQSLNFSQSSCPADPFAAPRKRDGIMGLSYQSLDPNNGDDIFSLLVKTHEIHNSFSMCLSDEGGMLVLGGVDPKMNSTLMKYTPITNERYYSVNCTGLRIDGNNLNSKSFQSISIVDSGTTIMFLKLDIFNDLIYYLVQHYSHLPGITTQSESLWNHQCFTLSDRQLEKYPTISMVFPNTEGGLFEVAIPPNLYMIKIDDMYCFGFEKLPIKSPYSVLIGDVALQGYNVHYNREDGSIGFAKVTDNCGMGQDNNQYHVEMISEEVQENDSLVVKIHAIDANGRDGGAPNVNVLFDIVQGNCLFAENQASNISVPSDRYGIVKTLLECSQDRSAIITISAFENNRVISNKIHFNLQTVPKSSDGGGGGGNYNSRGGFSYGSLFVSFMSIFVVVIILLVAIVSYYIKRNRYSILSNNNIDLTNIGPISPRSSNLGGGGLGQSSHQQIDMVNLLNTSQGSIEISDDDEETNY